MIIRFICWGLSTGLFIASSRTDDEQLGRALITFGCIILSLYVFILQNI
ncbi:MAG: hypothetical protein J6T10_28690 [Methanobrevibacter sp.]|nr:hypothetical protein [Methanobrevibacter sp.]